MAADSAIQGRSRNIQDSGGLRDIMMGQGKYRLDVLADEIMEGGKMIRGFVILRLGREIGIQKTIHDQRARAC
jgi:hypothetical protein